MAQQNADQLNALALSGVDLANAISRMGIKDDDGRPVTLTPGALTHWVARGCPRNRDNKTYNVFAVLAWFAGKQALTAHRPAGEMDEIEKARLADLVEKTLARRQARELEAGKLAKREDIHEEWMRLLHGVASGLTTLARVLVKEVVGQPEQIVRAKIDERVNDTLRAFAEGWDGEEGHEKTEI